MFFGHGERRLFGVYTPARGASGRNRRAVVLCHPWGQEYLRAHRTMKQLAVMLSSTGLDVLHFDYFGTGDSSGDMTDADLAGWAEDIVSAMQEIQDTTGASRVRIVGLRLGATLGAMAAAMQPAEVESVVLWDPIVSGEHYLRELLATQAWTKEGVVSPPARPVHLGGGHEILGFPMTARMADEISLLDLAEVVHKLPVRLLAVTSRPSAPAESLERALKERIGDPVPVEEIPCLPAWLEDRNTGAGAIPVPVMQRIVQWMQ